MTDEHQTFLDQVLAHVEAVGVHELRSLGASPPEIDDVCRCVAAYVAVYFNEFGLNVLAAVDPGGFELYVRRLAVEAWFVCLYLSRTDMRDERALAVEQIRRRALDVRLERADLSTDQRRLLDLVLVLGLTLDQSAQMLDFSLDEARAMLRAARIIAANTDILAPPLRSNDTKQRRNRHERRS